MKAKIIKHPKWKRKTDAEVYDFPDGKVVISVPKGANLTVAHALCLLEQVKFQILLAMYGK